MQTTVIFGVVVAAGEARRMGGASKPLSSLGGRSLIEHVVARVAPQVDRLALNLRPGDRAAANAMFGPAHPLLDDLYDSGQGPLGGVLAGLDWLAAEGAAHWLATFPGDTPFLPGDIVAQLAAARTAAPPTPVVAHDGRRLQPLCSLWPLDCREPLRRGIEEGAFRSLYHTLDALGAATCRLSAPADAFFNINTADDLLRAEQIMQAGGPHPHDLR
ncbi:molybdenum cofactor guanylyltransferase MobA [Parvibaculum sp.]|uniref:molybdenum cofactor guanylyltransferase MobA n=1 Tax=Parvibaculum sp. TaxID=2024848 RepID=UPI0034A0A4AE